MLSIIYLQLVMSVVFGTIIFVIFNKFQLNFKIYKRSNLKFRYDWISIFISFILLNVLLGPNIFDRINAYQDFQSIKSSQVEYISIQREKPPSTTLFKISDTDSINEFLKHVKKLDFSGSQRPDPDRSIWSITISESSFSPFRFEIYERESVPIFKLYSENSFIAFYKNQNFSEFFNVLDEKIKQCEN